MTDWSSTSAEPRPVPSGRAVRGEVAPPSSKSLTQRYLILAALSDRATTILRPLASTDIERAVEAVGKLGARATAVEGGWRLEPHQPASGGSLDCSDNGTLLRFLTAACATRPGAWQLHGTDRLHVRPLGPLVGALRGLGARVEELGVPGHAPVVVHGGALLGGRCSLDAGTSSQFLSALLLAAVGARSAVEVRVAALASAPYVDLTVEALGRFGISVQRPDASTWRVAPRIPRAADAVEVEADCSSACYPAAAAALTGGRVRLPGVRSGSRQGDRGWFDLLAGMGASVVWEHEAVRVEGGALAAVDVDLGDMPDQVPTLAALAPFAAGVSRIRGVAHLRHKESDRLGAMAEGLTRMGAVVVEHADGLEIPGVWADAAPEQAPVVVSARGDHRVAMSLALVGLRRPAVSISGWRAVAKSYPGFWDDLEGLLT